MCLDSPPAPANATFDCGASSLPNTTCNATCQAGYRGAASAICQEHGTWSVVDGGCCLVGKCCVPTTPHRAGSDVLAIRCTGTVDDLPCWLSFWQLESLSGAAVHGVCCMGAQTWVMLLPESSHAVHTFGQNVLSTLLCCLHCALQCALAHHQFLPMGYSAAVPTPSLAAIALLHAALGTGVRQLSPVSRMASGVMLKAAVS